MLRVGAGEPLSRDREELHPGQENAVAVRPVPKLPLRVLARLLAGPVQGWGLVYAVHYAQITMPFPCLARAQASELLQLPGEPCPRPIWLRLAISLAFAS